MMVVGIDPGLSGGVAWTDGEESGAIAMPVLDGRPNLDLVGGLLSDKRPGLVVLELVETRPGLGAPSVLLSGVNWGMLAGYLSGRGVPWQEVVPKVWKTRLGLPSSSVKGPRDETGAQRAARLARAQRARKEAAVRLALQLFPTVDLLATPRSTAHHDGMAEALLLAEYGRRERGGRS